MGAATGRNNPKLGALQLLQGLGGTLASAGRGALASTLGMPGDLESLVRLLPGLDSNTYLPTTQDMLRKIPASTASSTAHSSRAGPIRRGRPSGRTQAGLTPCLSGSGGGFHGRSGGNGHHRTSWGQSAWPIIGYRATGKRV